MKTYNYKTAKGLLKHTGQLNVEAFLNRRFHHNTGGLANFNVTDSVNKEICGLVASYCVATKTRARDLYHALMNQKGDASLFQCFYIGIYNGKVIISNSLSGSAFRYCVRTYLKKYCLSYRK